MALWLLNRIAVQGRSTIVAGAGLAGLSAAHELSRAGAAVTIVDARDHAGGRVRTIRDFDNGQHAEGGGEFIEREHRETVALCDTFGLRLIPVLKSGFTHRYRDSRGRYHVSRAAAWNALASNLDPLVRRYKAAGGAASSEPVREMATISMREWLHRADAPPELHAIANAMHGFFLADPPDISVLPFVEQIARGGSPAQARFFRIDGGNDRLVEALLRSMPARLLLRHTLRAIAQAADRVVVTLDDASGLTQQIEGDSIVVTLPASTLRAIDIRPPLPEQQWLAIERLSYGCATKVLVQASCFLFGSRHARAFATDARVGAFWDGGEEQPGPSSIITFLGGGSAAGTLREAAAHGGQALLADLCWLDMDASPVTRTHVLDWSADPWARGGYAYFDPGFDPAWRSLLRRRAGRIVFAGEHTSEQWQGYMNGAVESGQRAARELIDAPV
jgi:monoamine oxidase